MSDDGKTLDGCPGRRLVGRLAAYCSTCVRQPLGGPQIEPEMRLVMGMPYCPNHVPYAPVLLDGDQP